MLSSKLRKGLPASFPMGLWKYALKMKYHVAQPHFILLALSQSLENPNLCWSNSCVLSYSSQFRPFSWSTLLPTFILTDLQLLQFNIFSQLEEKRSQFFSTVFIIVLQEIQSAFLHFITTPHLTIETAFFHTAEHFHNNRIFSDIFISRNTLISLMFFTLLLYTFSLS